MRLKLINYHIDQHRLPRKLIIYGFVCVIFVILLAGSILFILPIQEKVSGRVEIHAFGLPITVKTKQSGQLFLHVSDQEEVKKGQLLATTLWDIGSETHADLEALVNGTYDLSTEAGIQALKEAAYKVRYAQLPDIQGQIARIFGAIEQYELQAAASNPRPIIESLEKEIEEKMSSLPLYDTLQVTKLAKLELIKSRLAADSLLYLQGAISQDEYTARKASLIDEESQIISTRIERQVSRQDVTELRSQISTKQADFTSQLAGFKTEIHKSLSELRKAYYDLAHDKIILSPADGTITKSPEVRSGNEYASGAPVLTIIPMNNEVKEEAYLFISLRRAGEIRSGQRIYIYLDEYSPRDYGAIEGVIKTKNPLPEDGQYRIELAVDIPMTTSFGFQIDPRPVYHGQGEVMTLRQNIYQKIMREIKWKQAQWRHKPS